MPLPSATPVPKTNTHKPTTVPALPIFKGSVLYSVDEFLGTFNFVAEQAELTEKEKLAIVFSYMDKELEPVLSILRTCSYNDWTTFERLLRTAYSVDTHGLEYVNHIIKTFKANTPGFGMLVFLECYFAYTGVLCGSGELTYEQRFQLLLKALPEGFVDYLKRYLPDIVRWLADTDTPEDMESWDRLIGLTRQYATEFRQKKLGKYLDLLNGEHAGRVCSTGRSTLSTHNAALWLPEPVSNNVFVTETAIPASVKETNTAADLDTASVEESRRLSSIVGTPPEYLMNPLLIQHKNSSNDSKGNTNQTSFMVHTNPNPALFSLNCTPALPPLRTSVSDKYKTPSTESPSNESTTSASNSNGTSAPETSTGESSPIVAGHAIKLPDNFVEKQVKHTPTLITSNSTTSSTKKTPYTLDDKERRVWELFLDANQRVKRHLISMTVLEEDSDENNYSVDDILNNTDNSMFADTESESSARGNDSEDRSGWSEPTVSVAKIMQEFGQPGLTPQKETALIIRYAESLICHKMSEFVDYPEPLLSHVFEVVLEYTYTNLAADRV